MIDWQSVRRHHCAFAILSISAFAISERSIALLIAGTSLSLASWLFTDRWRKRMLPSWAVFLLLLISFVTAFFRVYPNPQQFQIPSTIGILLLFGLVVRMYSRRSVSDERQILMMSSILLVIAALQCSDLIVGILVLCATLMAVNCVIRFRLAASVSDQFPLGVAGGGILRRESAVQRKMMKRGLLEIVGVALFLVTGLTLVIFICLPRNSQPKNGLFGITGRNQFEFSDQISLMSPQRLSPSEIELFTVEWLGPDGKHPPIQEMLWLRGSILEKYNPAVSAWFVRTTSMKRFVISEGGQYKSFANEPNDERMNTFTLRVEPHGLSSDVLLSPWVPISISGSETQVYVLVPSTMELRSPDHESLGSLSGYEIRVQPFASESTLASLQGESMRDSPLATFPVPAIEDAALKILSGMDMDSTRAQVDPATRWKRNIRIAKIFESELKSDRFRYTLDLRSFVRIGDRDPIDLFLNEYRFGHCEYFASALCALCQSVGVDARIVVGYLASEFDKSSQRYIVRESDGHAWVEIRTGEYQWTKMDPTPASEMNTPPQEDESWAVVMRFIFAPINSLWRDEIAQFDARSQNALVQQTNDWFHKTIQSFWAMIQRTARSAGESSRWISTSSIWFGSVALTLTLSCAAMWIAYRKWQRTQRALGLTRRGRIRTKVALRDCAFYVDALDILERRGIRRPLNLLPSSFAELVRVQHPIGGDIFIEIVKRFYAIRFGGERPDPRRRAEDHALVGRMRQALIVAR